MRKKEGYPWRSLEAAGDDKNDVQTTVNKGTCSVSVILLQLIWLVSLFKLFCDLQVVMILFMYILHLVITLETGIN